jgi:hypothetical protein
MIVYTHQVAPGRAQTNTNDRNSKFKTGAMVAGHLLSDRNVSVIGISELDIIWYLGFESWDFRFVFREANYFYLSQLESTLTLSWTSCPSYCFCQRCLVISLKLMLCMKLYCQYHFSLRTYIATDSHRKTPTYLSPFVICRLYDDFEMRSALDTFAVWGVVCCDQNAFAFS